jgi:Nif-specific regulatory protein
MELKESSKEYISLLQNRSLNEAELLNRLVLCLTRDFSCQRASIFIRDKDDQFLTAVAQGLEGMDIDVKPGEGLAGKAIAAGAVLISNEAAYDVRSLCRVRDHYTGFHTHSLLVAPFFSRRHRPVGAFQLLNKQNGVFGQEDIFLAETISSLFGSLHDRLTKPIRNLWTLEMELRLLGSETEDSRLCFK